MRVANGQMIPSEAMSISVKLKIQGTIFIVDVRILVLTRFDIVLGIQWLRYLGFILWNFEELSIKFNYGSKAVEKRGLVVAQLFKKGSINKFHGMEKKEENHFINARGGTRLYAQG